MAEIIIILEQRKLYLYTNNQLDNSFPVAIGKSSTPTPTGQFSIINKIDNPYNPALGSRWLQFTYENHGIHGTNQPSLIGRSVSAGCVRMYNQEVEYVYNKVSCGTPVKIKNNKHVNSNEYFIYIVKPNDTLYHIAHKFNTSISKLQEINQIPNKNLIYPGQKLKIPYPKK
ncbi:MAG: L,D-transpeptidase family protein [Bacillota bacterium]